MSGVRIVFANDLPYVIVKANPLDALRDVLAFAADDWGTSRAKAWIYGIVLGWDADPFDPDGTDAMDDVAGQFGWTDEQVAHLRALHVEFDRQRTAARPADPDQDGGAS